MADIDPEAPSGRRKDGTPRKPNAAQQGLLIKGAPGSRPPGGKGWGGEAKGEGRKEPFDETCIAPLMRAKDPEAYASKREYKLALAAEMVQIKLAIARTTENEVLKLNAPTSIEHRLLGW